MKLRNVAAAIVAGMLILAGLVGIVQAQETAPQAGKPFAIDNAKAVTIDTDSHHVTVVTVNKDVTAIVPLEKNGGGGIDITTAAGRRCLTCQIGNLMGCVREVCPIAVKTTGSCGSAAIEQCMVAKCAAACAGVGVGAGSGSGISILLSRNLTSELGKSQPKQNQGEAK
jgi:hypothetical protein